MGSLSTTGCLKTNEAQSAIGRMELSDEAPQVARRLSRDEVKAVWLDTSLKLGRLALALGVNREQVDDILQEVFHAAWKYPSGFAADIDLRRWLFRVTINECNKVHRKASRWRRAWTEVVRRATLDLNSHESRSELQAAVRDALDKLPHRQRAILILRYFEGYDSKEIGNILEVPDSTVRSQLRAARAALAGQLRQLGLGDD